jgi:hypothetical protein
VQDLSQEIENTQDDEHNELFEASSEGKDSDLESLPNNEEDKQQQIVNQIPSKGKQNFEANI